MNLLENIFFQVNLSFKPFSSDEFDVLYEALEDFISQVSSTKDFYRKMKQREFNGVQLQIILYPPSNQSKTQKNIYSSLNHLRIMFHNNWLLIPLLTHITLETIHNQEKQLQKTSCCLNQSCLVLLIFLCIVLRNMILLKNLRILHKYIPMGSNSIFP